MRKEKKKVRYFAENKSLGQRPRTQRMHNSLGRFGAADPLGESHCLFTVPHHVCLPLVRRHRTAKQTLCKWLLILSDTYL